ncbi:MAG: hypothetical protein ACM3PC_12415 [Deltaproteobacteria bacterium]
MIAWKFLRNGGVAPFTGFTWVPGAWVSGRPAHGAGVHACRLPHLPYWVDDELWRIELGEPVVEHPTQVEGARGRLMQRVTAWDPAAFAQACAGRARAFALEAPSPELWDYARLAERAPAGSAAYIAAVAAVAARGEERAFAEERAWQARWLQEELALRDG